MGTDVAARYLNLPIHAFAIEKIGQYRLPGNQPPWQKTNLFVERDQDYALFAEGLIKWSTRYPHLHGGPAFHLWARVTPGSRTVNLTAESGTFTADVSGELEIGIYMGMWSDLYGTLATPEKLYRHLTGELDVVCVTFNKKATAFYDTVRGKKEVPELISNEIRRFDNFRPPPSSWHYLNEAGHAEIFHTESKNPSIIRAIANNDQGILRREIDFPLATDTEISWGWQVNLHPSEAPENEAVTHDYVSLAVEFDNGRDLTWIWSSCLEKETFFDCPVRAWQEREMHYVVRSADDKLGHWYQETRNIYDDVSRAMGPPPQRITAVWLIALSTFHHRVADASFADICLRRGDRVLTVMDQ